MKKCAVLLIATLSGCGKPCPPESSFVRTYPHHHVSDPELEQSVKGVTYDKGPARWWGLEIIDWLKEKFK